MKHEDWPETRTPGQALSAYLSATYGDDGTTASTVMSGLLVGMMIGLEHAQLATEVLNDTFAEPIVGGPMRMVSTRIKDEAVKTLGDWLSLPLETRELTGDEQKVRNQVALVMKLREQLAEALANGDPDEA